MHLFILTHTDIVTSNFFAGVDPDDYERMHSINDGRIRDVNAAELAMQPRLRTCDRIPYDSKFARVLFSLDNRFFKPLLTHSRPSLMVTMSHYRKGRKVWKLFTSYEQIQNE